MTNKQWYMPHFGMLRPLLLSIAAQEILNWAEIYKASQEGRLVGYDSHLGWIIKEETSNHD